MHIIIDKETLSQRSEEIDIKLERAALNTIILNLKETLRENPNVIGLSAIQIGYPKRVIVINFNGKLQTFINPLINKCVEGYVSTEEDPSIPNKEFMVVRGNVIEFFYQTPLTKNEGGKLSGLSAQVFQRLVDRLDGIGIDDYGIELTEEIKSQTPEEREEMLKAYVEFLDTSVEELKKEVQEEVEEALNTKEEEPKKDE